MSWTETLSFPFMQHAILAALFAGIAFPMIGVFIISLNLIPLRFAMMHIALLGGAIGLFLKIDPIFSGMLFCALSSLALGPISEKTKLGVGTISGYFMALTLALAFILFYKADIHVLQAFNILWGNILSLTLLDLIFVIVISLIILSVIILFFKEIQAILYDREIALAVGIPEKDLLLFDYLHARSHHCCLHASHRSPFGRCFYPSTRHGSDPHLEKFETDIFLFVPLRFNIGDDWPLPLFSFRHSNEFNNYYRGVFDHRNLFFNTKEVNHAKIEEDDYRTEDERFGVLDELDIVLKLIIACHSTGSSGCLNFFSRSDRQSSRSKGCSGHCFLRHETSPGI